MEHLMATEAERVYCSVCGWGTVVPSWSVVGPQEQLQAMGDLYRQHISMVTVGTLAVSILQGAG